MSTTSTPMQWVTPDLLVAEVPLHGAATSISTVAVEGTNAGHATLPPVCAPYSPEYAPSDEAAGRGALQRLARLTGGKERVALADIWRDLPRRRRGAPDGLARRNGVAVAAAALVRVLAAAGLAPGRAYSLRAFCERSGEGKG